MSLVSWARAAAVKNYWFESKVPWDVELRARGVQGVTTRCMRGCSGGDALWIRVFLLTSKNSNERQRPPPSQLERQRAPNHFFVQNEEKEEIYVIFTGCLIVVFQILAET